MGIQIMTGRFHFDLEAALFEQISRAKSRDPLAPVYVIVGSNLLGLYLRRKLADSTGGHINVHFLTFDGLVSMFEGFSESMSPPLAEQAIIERIIAVGDIPPVFAPVAATAGIGEALLSTFTDLSEAGCTPDIADRIAGGFPAKENFSERVRGTFDLYGRFIREVVGAGRSFHARFGEAAENARAFETSSPFLAYGFYDFNELQLRLIESLGEGPGLILFAPDLGNEESRITSKTYRRLERTGFTRENVSRDERAAPALEFFSSPGEEEEIGTVTRRIMKLAETGVRFCDIGLLVPSRDLYLPIIEQVFGDAGVPYFCQGGPSRPVLNAARGLEALLGLLSGRIERAPLIDFLVSAPLKGCEGIPDMYHIWVKKSAEAGMLGVEEWGKENGTLLDRLRRAGPDNGGSHSVCAVEASARSIEGIEQARDEVQGAGTWSGFNGTVLTLVRELFSDDEHVRQVIEAAEDLGALDALTGPVTFPTYSRILARRLSNLGRQRGRFMGSGVNVLSLGEARGLSFEHLFIPGLAERIFPSIPRQDAFLTDRDRREITALAGGEIYLSERLERLDEEAFIFSLALDSASAGLHLSFPRMEQDTGRERIESSFLRFVRRHPSVEGELTAKRVHRFGLSDERPLSELEFNLLRVIGGKTFSPRLGFFERAVGMERARVEQPVFTEYEGVFSSNEAIEILRARFGGAGRTFSPTSLETYAGCPFKYFLNKVLELETVDEPDKMIQITPLLRGSIVHEILAGLYERFQKEGLLPLDAAKRDMILRAAGDAAGGFLERYEDREPVGLEVFWEIEKRNMTEAVLDYLAYEMDEPSDLVPSHFELWFGSEPAVSIRTGVGPVSFHGRIDRIDAGDGEGFRVIDYKTGSLKKFKDQGLAKGTHLQLPVYLLAAAHFLGRPVEKGIACYRYVGTKRGKREARFSGEQWDESKAEFERIIETVVNGIERGHFWAVPGSLCDYCDVKGVCPTIAKRVFESKAEADQRCHDYLRMRSYGEGVE
jgi:RecB family exonuclease